MNRMREVPELVLLTLLACRPSARAQEVARSTPTADPAGREFFDHTHANLPPTVREALYPRYRAIRQRRLVQAQAKKTAKGLPEGAPLGEVFVFPNPAKGDDRPVLHLEIGSADGLEVRIYDLSGALVGEAEVRGPPGTLGERTGYEEPLDVARLGSGVYVYQVVVKIPGREALRAHGKFALVR